MELINYYRVIFDTKKGGDRSWVIDVPAKNAKEARIVVDQMWKREMHKFHIKVRKIKDTEEILYHYFVEVEE